MASEKTVTTEINGKPVTVKRKCNLCTYSGMDMDMDPYCAHPSLKTEYPFGKTLTRPIPGCSPDDNHPLFEVHVDRLKAGWR